MRNYFVTDLDRTIIHSKNPTFKCVEKMGDREITYMTDKSYSLLQELLPKVEFIPCTMRNLKQTLRVDFIRKYSPKYIICTNGAQIYIDDKLDETWDNYMRSLLKENEVNNIISKIEKLNLNALEIRNIEGFYVALKFNTIEDATNSLERLRGVVGTEYVVLQSRVKVFLINEKIDKANALNYLKEKYNFEHIHTARDSIYDMKFTGLDYVYSYLPKHAEFNHPKAYISEKDGIEATDSILQAILDNLK